LSLVIYFIAHDAVFVIKQKQFQEHHQSLTALVNFEVTELKANVTVTFNVKVVSGK